MRGALITVGFLLATIATSTAAQTGDPVASTTIALSELRLLPPNTIIPAIRQQGSMAKDQILCLALAMYHEARGETENERLAVAQVIYNRAIHTDSTICATVWAENGSQFQWVKSTATIVPKETRVWQAVQYSAVSFARHRPADKTRGATNFYNPALCSPNWTDAGKETVRLHQVFLRIDGRFTGRASATDPISQVDQLGRLRPSRTYAGGKS